MLGLKNEQCIRRDFFIKAFVWEILVGRCKSVFNLV